MHGGGAEPMISDAHKERIRLRMAGLTAMPLEQGHIFYKSLFERMPETRALFDDNLDEQAEKLIDMMFLVVHFLDGVEALREEIVALGARHLGYGMRPEHLEAAKSAILEALGATLDNWSEDDTAAWNALLTQLMLFMQEGLDAEHERVAEHQQAEPLSRPSA